MKILRGYGMGPNLVRLLGHYWGKQSVALKLEKFLGWRFVTGQGITQGDPELLIISNIMVDAVAHEVLAEVCGIQETHHGLGWVAGYSDLVFYAY